MIGYVGRGHSDWIGAVWKELVLFAGDGFGHGAPSEPLESDWRLRMAMVSYKDQSSRLTPLTLVKMIGVLALIVVIFIGGLKVNEYLETNEMKGANAIFMVIWGVGIVALFFAGTNWVVEQLPAHITSLIQPYLFVGPAIVILLWALAIPTIRTVIYSVKDPDGIHWIGGNEASAAGAGLTPILVQALISVAILIVLWLICRAVERRKIGGAAARGGLFKSHALKVTVIVAAVAVVFVLPVVMAIRKVYEANGLSVIPIFENYVFAFTDLQMLIVFRNNLLWLIFGTFLSVFLGLLIATLADRTDHEKFFKTIIFMPMAISFVGAGVIFKFIYDYKGQGAQIGLLNAIIELFGGTTQAWLQVPFWNNFALIVIMIWLQTGYCMVILSSAIKGISNDLLEAARIDGANEFQIFFRIIIPVISGAIIAVTTTVAIFSLKTFDIVRSMTGGQYGTNVIANEFFNQRFLYYNKGRASAIAVVLLILVIPVMIMNLKQFNERKAF